MIVKMSSEIKNSIGLLCKLLNLLYKTNLKPEYFRLAKFNKTDENVVPILWNLLVKILDEGNINILKRKLYNLNYRRNQFYSYTEAYTPSRGLLLAIGFLISVYLEETITNELNNSVFSANFDPFKKQHYSKHTTNGHQKFNWQKLDQNGLDNYKQWIWGKTCTTKNTILEYKEHIFKMQEKFNKALDIKANGTLTVYEILALKNKTMGEKFIRETEPIINILSIYTEWLKKEKHFWKWMESVVIEEEKYLNSECSVQTD